MNIGTNWQIKSDSMNIILMERKKRHKKDSKETYYAWETQGYYRTLQGVLKELVNQAVRDTQLRDLRTVGAKLDSLYKMIDSSLDKSVPRSILGGVESEEV